VSASGDGTVKMWDVATGTCTMTLRGHTSNVLSCCLSSTDQFILSTDWYNTLKVWDVATGNCTHTFPDFGQICTLSGDDQRIVGADNHHKIIRIVDIKTEEIHTEQMNTMVWSMCWSSDDQFLVLGTDEGVQIRDPETLKLFNVDETDSE
jgi:WD40 repeat protein